MKSETKIKIKNLFDRVYDIVTIQLIGTVVFILLGLSIKFIGGDIYNNSRKIYYNAINSKIETEVITDDRNLTDEISSDISSYFMAEENNILSQQATSKTESNVSETIQTNASDSTFTWPLSGKITANFGDISYLFSGPNNSHTGIDIAGITGTPIKACADGTVTFAGFSQGFGNYMIIKHNGNLSTLYAHCSELLYKQGANVSRGDVIALVGCTGKATGSHLHLEVLSNNKSIDPLWVLPMISNI